MQSIHTGVLSILVNFKSVFLLKKKKTLQESLSVQVDLNREIKEGLILLLACEKDNENRIRDTQHQFSN